jgi:hypothetical protein
LRERERERRFIINASEQRGFLPPHSKYTKIELAFFSLLCEKRKKIIAEEGQPQRNGRNGFLMKG